MKKHTLILAVLVLMAQSLLAANIPGGKTLYLDATKWNSYSYFSAYFWSNTSNGNYVAMSPVTGAANIWQVTAPAGSWTNVIFRAHSAAVPASGTGWGSNVAIQTNDLTYDGTKDMWVPVNNSDKGSGAWSIFVMPCQTTYYTFDTLVCTSDLPVSWRGFTFASAGVQTTSVAHKDPALTCDSIRNNYVLITRDCGSDIVHDTLRLCKGAAAAMLTTTTVGDAYEWSTGATTCSISVNPTTEGDFTYTCNVGTVGTVSLNKNIITNGGFEDTTHTATSYVGFTSDYEFYSPKQSFDMSKSYRGFYKLDGSNYYGATPHSGNFMMICDGDENRKEAWSALTTEPIIRGKQYRFSFWAYNAFTGTSIADKNCPKLSFYIEMNGKTYQLVPEQTLPNNIHGWVQYGQNLSWTASESAVQARVFLVDNCLSNSNNDFALDDIVFQPLFGEDSQTTEIFPVLVTDCSEPEPPTPVDPCEGFQTQYLKVDTTVCDTLLPFVWHGYTYTQAKSFYDTIPSKIGCGDSIITTYTLKTEHCERPEPEPCLSDLVYAKWTNFLFCDNGRDEFIAFQWYRNNAAIVGQTKQYLYLEAGMGQDQYLVEVTRTDGTKAKTCPLTYGEAPRSVDTYTTPTPTRRVSVPLGTNELIVFFDEDNHVVQKVLQVR